MKTQDDLLKLDYLVFSSHKTATQSVKVTLNSNGLVCIHCHHLTNLGMARGSLLPILQEYLRRNQKKLSIISTFREPIERHVSSFFQSYGRRPLRKKEVEHESETIIARHQVKDLQQQFITEVNEGTLTGMRESIDEICEETLIERDTLTYDSRIGFGVVENDLCKLFLLRFDVLIENFGPILSLITGKTVTERHRNLSSSRWYKSKYEEFKATLTLPDETIRSIYTSKVELINLMYGGQFKLMLDSARKKYGALSVSSS